MGWEDPSPRARGRACGAQPGYGAVIDAAID